MSNVFKKLNLKGASTIVVIDSPESFERELGTLEKVDVRRAFDDGEGADFVLVFATRQADVNRMADLVASSTEGDAVVWFAYPKGSSRRYTCDFNRDTGWSRLGEHGFEPVRQVAIDDDWSALRFRRVEYIRKLRRNPDRALSEKGRLRAEDAANE